MPDDNLKRNHYNVLEEKYFYSLDILFPALQNTRSEIDLDIFFFCIYLYVKLVLHRPFTNQF